MLLDTLFIGSLADNWEKRGLELLNVLGDPATGLGIALFV
jgi:hypothetical protein